jgi:cold shock CspA family protein
MSETQTKMTGDVAFFNNQKGWGLITTEGESFFVHHTHIVDKRFFPEGKPKRFRTLKAGTKVTFTPEDKRSDSKYFKMRCATNVEVSNEG